MAQKVHMSEFWYLYGQTFRLMGKVSLWVPLLLHAALAVVLVLMHYYIFSPLTGSIIKGWTGLVNADYAPLFYHYPSHFTLLPYFYGLARLVVNIFTEALLFGVVIDLFIAIYRNQKPAFMTSFGHALRRYLKLSLVWLVLLALLYVINRYFNTFLEDVLGYSLQDAPRRQMMAQLIARGITVIIYSVCIFLLPAIMAEAGSFGAAIKRGFKAFARHPFVAIGIVLIPYLIGLLPSWVLSDPGRIVTTFYPELVFYLVLVSIGVDIIVNFILLGTSLKFYMDQST